jgi:hypothetical protein
MARGQIDHLVHAFDRAISRRWALCGIGGATLALFTRASAPDVTEARPVKVQET